MFHIKDHINSAAVIKIDDDCYVLATISQFDKFVVLYKAVKSKDGDHVSLMYKHSLENINEQSEKNCLIK